MSLFLEEKLHQRKKLGNVRQLQITQNLIDFSSNDYLGLARSSVLSAAVLHEWEANRGLLNGLGSTGSRLLTGNTFYAENLEKAIASFHGYEAGLLFNCGYMANVGLLSTIASSNDVIFFDSAIHASTRDGIRLSRAKAFPFRHNDFEHLESRLKQCSVSGNRFICIESIYSTDGSLAPLSAISLLAKSYQAYLIVDEAHSVGVCGERGRGLVAEQRFTSQVFAQVTTFGKALGVQGAIVLGSHLLIDALINFATSYMYTTALPFQALAAIKCSYEQFPQLEQERKQIKKLIRIFQQNFIPASGTHIQSIRCKGNNAVKELAKKLMQHGLDVRPLMSPTVQRGCEALRVCLHVFNTEEQLYKLLSLL